MAPVVLLLGAAATAAVSAIPLPIAPPSTTCAFYQLAFDYAKVVQPNLTAGQSAAVWDALALQDCNSTSPRPDAPGSAEHRASAQLRHKVSVDIREERGAGSQVFVDAAIGNDLNDGTLTSPLKTLAAAQKVARKVLPATIVLRGGIHHVRSSTLD